MEKRFKNIKLAFEMIPSQMHYINLRNILPFSDWETVRKNVYKINNYKCQICGETGKNHPVEAHEVWEYDFKTGTQILKEVQALCPLCHECKHIGLSYARGVSDRAIERIIRINDFTNKEFKEYSRENYDYYTELCKINWKLDISTVINYGIEPIKKFYNEIELSILREKFIEKNKKKAQKRIAYFSEKTKEANAKFIEELKEKIKKH